MIKLFTSYRFLHISLLLAVMKSLPVFVSAQTCCSGGVNLAGNVGGLQQAEKGLFQFSLSFDGNFLNTLKDGNNNIQDHSRERITYTTLFKAAYSFNERLSVEALLSFVNQRRIINQAEFHDFTSTLGMGDAIILAHYNYFIDQSLTLGFGAGPKIPTGPSDLKNQQGFIINADMQPGSGAWDFFLYHHASWGLPFRPNATINLSAIFRISGENSSYLVTQTYKAGDEFQIITGWSEQNTIVNQVISYGMHIRYRNAKKDINNGSIANNTGGNWVFITPSFSWFFSPAISVFANTELPVFSKVGGTQLTPDFRFNAGLLYTVNRNK
ncbi:MAG: hypothetical protein ABR597_05230 [Bacteroidales bacterium]